MVQPVVLLGGPNPRWHILPRPIESILSWQLCLSCLLVSGYYYIKSTYIIPFLLSVGRHRRSNSKYGITSRVRRWIRIGVTASEERYDTTNDTNDDDEDDDDATTTQQDSSFVTCWIPLTTHSRAELQRASPIERYHQLIQILPQLILLLTEDDDDNDNVNNNNRQPSSTQHHDNDSTTEDITTTSTTTRIGETVEGLDDATILRLFRSNTICRRLASLVMRPYRIKLNEDGGGGHGWTGTKMLSLFGSSPSLLTRTTTTMTALILEHPEYPLVRKLADLWPQLLELPPSSPTFTTEDEPKSTNEETKTTNYDYEISVILPAYRESPTLLRRKLELALQYCDTPSQVEIIVVDASSAGGGHDTEGEDVATMLQTLQSQRHIKHTLNPKDVNNNNQNGKQHPTTTTTEKSSWGNVHYLPFLAGGGRGPCLNFGATAARGCIVTFCHMDTSMPLGWDTKIKRELLCCGGGGRADAGTGRHQQRGGVRANCCAFQFGIDTTIDGLRGAATPNSATTITATRNSLKQQKHQTQNEYYYYPPGIKAVERTANIRTRLYSLPYGDQTLSLPKIVFDFLGGFPDQCLMEDYELVALLRRRVSMLPSLSTTTNNNCATKERLGVIPGPPALCSPRRWQKFGVLYVTYMNSKLVNLYNTNNNNDTNNEEEDNIVASGGGSGMERRQRQPDNLYRRYYGCDPPKREDDLSPWEMEMESILFLASGGGKKRLNSK